MQTHDMTCVASRLAQCDSRVSQWREHVVLVEWADPRSIQTVEDLSYKVSQARRLLPSLEAPPGAEVGAAVGAAVGAEGNPAAAQRLHDLVEELEAEIDESVSYLGLPASTVAPRSLWMVA